MRRLHIQFYLAILATLGVFLAASAIFWNLTGSWRGEAWGVTAVAQLVEGLLPPASAPISEQQAAIDNLNQRVRIPFALYDGTGRLLASHGNLAKLPPRKLARTGWAFGNGGPVWILPLDDGRKLVIRPHHMPHGASARVFIVPLSFVLAFALGAYPIARRLTRRLARLQSGVEQLGQGDLATRVAVEGRDEVAALARSFNDSAERIEALLKSHKLLLANCSHELRTPLARIRLGLERIAGDSDSALRDELTRSIGELDALIGEMLLASRLDALQSLEHAEDVDLLALAAEEAAHFDRAVEGRPAIVRGDPALLRRMLRNLLDNAQRHADGATRIHVGESPAGLIELIVEDRGHGVPEAEREKIFEPFYRSTQTGSTSRGFGLGLALVRQIVRAHGGEVRYAPSAEGGSRFIVTLPNSSRAQRPAPESLAT